MTNREHLIENAFLSCQRGASYQDWTSSERKDNANLGIYGDELFNVRDLEIIWSCVKYVKDKWCNCCYRTEIQQDNILD